jgi:uncharacterized Zn finger protein (UPF0148 family)
MSENSKATPLFSPRKDVRCPVCGEASYSKDGVHPQCSVKRADQKRATKIKADRIAGKTTKPVDGIKTWQRVCPKCKSVQHVRKKMCECGEALTHTTRNASDEF